MFVNFGYIYVNDIENQTKSKINNKDIAILNFSSGTVISITVTIYFFITINKYKQF